MKIMNFKKVATSTNDADGKGYFVPADSILMLRQTDANTVKVQLKAIAGTTNDVVGDNIKITATGKAEEVGDYIAQRMYGNMQTGAISVIDAASEGGAIVTQIIETV